MIFEAFYENIHNRNDFFQENRENPENRDFSEIDHSDYGYLRGKFSKSYEG